VRNNGNKKLVFLGGHKMRHKILSALCSVFITMLAVAMLKVMDTHSKESMPGTPDMVFLLLAGLLVVAPVSALLGYQVNPFAGFIISDAILLVALLLFANQKVSQDFVAAAAYISVLGFPFFGALPRLVRGLRGNRPT